MMKAVVFVHNENDGVKEEKRKEEEEEKRRREDLVRHHSSMMELGAVSTFLYVQIITEMWPAKGRQSRQAIRHKVTG